MRRSWKQQENISDEDLAQVEEMGKKKAEITSEIKKVIVGQEKVIEEILVALFCRGHCLLVGVPGLAKTLLISTLAGIMELRVQPGPVHLRPDALGHHGNRHIGGRDGKQEALVPVHQGPIFTNILLADEINRTPPKTQAALLQAMQEYKVTAGGVTHPLDLPFFVLATQNPIEQEGTYPLPEAQLDRFMFNIRHRLSSLRPGDGDRGHNDFLLPACPQKGHQRREDTADAGPGEKGSRLLPCHRVCGEVGPFLSSQRTGSPSFREGVGGMGGRPKGIPAPDPCSEGQGHHEPAVRGLRGGCQGRGSFYLEAPDHHELQGPGRGDHLAQGHRTSSRRGEALNHFDPKVLAKLKKLYLRARFVVDGVMIGIHPSRAKGLSAEFEEHREYSQGDDVRRIDWKAYGKFDRYFIKEYREATNLKAHILLDSSSSMGYASDGWSKFDYGSTLTASLAYLMLKQQDAVGLITFSNQIEKIIPPKAIHGYLFAILRELEERKPRGMTRTGSVLQELAGSLKRRGLILLISDLLDEPEEVLKGLKQLRSRGNDVIVFHLLDKDELNFPFQGGRLFSRTWKRI